MRSSGREKKIKNFEVKFCMKLIDGEYEGTLEYSDKLVFEEHAFIEIQMYAMRLVDQIGRDSRDMVSEEVEALIKKRLRDEKGVYFEDEIDGEFIDEHFDGPGMITHEGDVQEAKVGKPN